ncbi:MAG: hypothetical protein JXA77_15445 [Bacteroidales bacterium]|nr:hypothetical protein [Bacteroidales bacterium]
MQSIEIIDDKEEASFEILSENTLKKEWNSEENNIWDTRSKKKLLWHQ